MFAVPRRCTEKAVSACPCGRRECNQRPDGLLPLPLAGEASDGVLPELESDLESWHAAKVSIAAAARAIMAKGAMREG